MMFRCLVGVLAGVLIAQTQGLQISPAAYVKLRKSDSGTPGFGTEMSATAAAYDPDMRYLYVIGTEGDVLNILDVQNPTNPRLIRRKTFSEGIDGLPDAIAICDNQNLVAISFEKRGTTNKAYVRVYRTLTDATENLEIVEERIDLDGVDPTSMAWTEDCSHLVVVQQGRVHTVNGIFEDPEPAVDFITNIGFHPTRTKVSINAAALTAAGARHVFQTCENSPDSTPSTIVQDAEPRDVVINHDKQAFISFPKNNVFGRLNLNIANPQMEYMFVGSKNWQSSRIDTVDNNSIDPANYPIHTFYQPLGLVYFPYNGGEYVASANAGDIMRLTLENHACRFDESAAGINWIADESFGDIDSGIRDQLTQDMSDPNKLGWCLSTLANSSRYTTLIGTFTVGGYTQVTGYGGRGMSIWNTQTITQTYDSGDKMETEFEKPGIPDNVQSIFNADIGLGSNTPSSRKDNLSPTTGPTPRAIATGLVGNKRVIVTANGEVGGLYFFEFDHVPGGEPNAPLMTYFRRGGSTGLSWQSLYNQDSDAVGEPETKDIIWIDTGSETEAVLAVLSNRAGSVSLYQLTA